MPNQTQPVCTHFCSIRACLQKSFYTSGKKLGILDSRNSFMAVGWLPSCCLLTLPGATGVAGCKPVSPIGLLVGGWLPPCCLLTLPGAAGVAGCRTVSPMGLLAGSRLAASLLPAHSPWSCGHGSSVCITCISVHNMYILQVVLHVLQVIIHVHVLQVMIHVLRS